MSANHWDQRTLQILTALVLVLSIPVLGSWLTPVASMVQASRGIASVGGVLEVAPPPENKLSRPVTIQWNLSGENFTQEIQGTHLRIKGIASGLTADSIVNESNGFTASVFVTGDEFTTDFIELKEGANLIQIQVLDDKGRKRDRKIEVTRRLPAAVDQKE